MNKKKSRKLRFVIVFITPLVLAFAIFLYFGKVYTYQNSEIDISSLQDSISVGDLDPLGAKVLIPDFVSENLKFVLCLNNKNTLYLNDKLTDPKDLPKEFDTIKRSIGAMDVRVSQIPELKLYTEREESKCVRVDMQKLLSSVVSSDVNGGSLTSISVSETQAQDLSDKKIFNVLVKPAYIDISKTHLYARMLWSNFLFILIGLYPTWFAFVLLVKSTLGFVRGEAKEKLAE